MVKTNKKGKPVLVYIDELTLVAVYQLISRKSKPNVIVLESMSGIRQKYFRWILSLKGIDVTEAVFFSGHVKTDQGEGIPFIARRIAAEISFKAAKDIVKSTSIFSILNSRYDKDTIRLFFAKKLHIYTEYWVHRIMIAKNLSGNYIYEIWLKKPDHFTLKLLKENFADLNLFFYSTFKPTIVKLFSISIRNLLLELKNFKLGKLDKKNSYKITNLSKPSVLIYQENTNIRYDRKLRAQPHHWIYSKANLPVFEINLIETKSFKRTTTDIDKELLLKDGINIYSISIIRNALKQNKKNIVLKNIKKQKKDILKSIFSLKNFDEKFFTLQLFFLFHEAEKIGALSLFLNAKVFLNREPQFVYSDAMQLVANDLGITTIAYQYSNMGSISPMMMSTADKTLIFSDIYKKIYEFDGISPKEYISTGYIFNGIAGILNENSLLHRKQLRDAGAEFVICYFDETVEHTRWGVVNKYDHLIELQMLAKLVIEDPTVGLVMKSQYMRNSPTLMYPDDNLIQSAKATGRFLELANGIHRNEIYPAEAALAADICISHKFGATAGLEAAVLGKRTILLDNYGVATFCDDIYRNANIIYNDMHTILIVLKGYRNGNPKDMNLGDWTHILSNFDPYNDKNAAGRFFDEINKSFN